MFVHTLHSFWDSLICWMHKVSGTSYIDLLVQSGCASVVSRSAVLLCPVVLPFSAFPPLIFNGEIRKTALILCWSDLMQMCVADIILYFDISVTGQGLRLWGVCWTGWPRDTIIRFRWDTDFVHGSQSSETLADSHSRLTWPHLTHLDHQWFL